MQVPLTLGHPLARLVRLLSALERVRTGVDPREKPTVRRDPYIDAVLAEDPLDLEGLSLSRVGPSPGRPCDDLGFLSLSLVEGPVPDRHGSLTDLSLTRKLPPRSGI
jgi:hypothetical protein